MQQEFYCSFDVHVFLFASIFPLPRSSQLAFTPKSEHRAARASTSIILYVIVSMGIPSAFLMREYLVRLNPWVVQNVFNPLICPDAIIISNASKKPPLDFDCLWVDGLFHRYFLVNVRLSNINVPRLITGLLLSADMYIDG